VTVKPYHRLFDGLRPTLHIAHRGGAALGPENTIAAFRLAVERWRTDMLELDVHFSRDGVAWVSHDPTVDRCTDGEGAISDLNSSELERLDAGHRFSADGKTFPSRGAGVRIPRLREVLEKFGDVLLNIDLKGGAPEALAAEVRPFRSRICWGAEQDAVGARLAELLPDACCFYPREALTAWVLTVRSGEPAPEDPRFHVMDMPLTFEGVRLIDDTLLKVAGQQGKWINVWTVDDPAEMDRLVAEGVGGIMTDRPDLLRQVLDK
jgi:glycerophosphoryl diester phosphodiesterase